MRNRLFLSQKQSLTYTPKEEPAIYAQLLIDIAHAEVDRLFTYAVPEGMPLAVGQHVRAPFGRGNRMQEGFVLACLKELPEDISNVKQIDKILEPYPVFTEQQLELARWMQRTYNCLLVDALRLMIPAQMRGGRVREKQSRTLCIPEGLDVAAAQESLLGKDGTPKAPKQMEVFRFLAESSREMTSAELNACIPGAGGAVAALIKKGLLQEGSQVFFRRPGAGKNAREDIAVQLTQAQQAVVDAVDAGMQKGEGVFLLHGVTGSGKTEVYMHCIRRCMEQGRQAILLVPEISLTPQTMGHFRARFGEAAALLHSRLSAGERFDEWRRIRLGLAKVAVGARSAVFAPFEKLGLIVVDEEHEPSYQSEHAPRYNAVEVAIKRCALAQAPLLLGSATPGIGSYMRARAGRYKLLELPERINRQPLPEVTIVDMREEFLAGNAGIFSAALHTALADCLGQGRQAILFLNRRGYSTFVSCRGCGHVFQCPHCDISATYHKTEELVKCHFCGHTGPVPTVCPECGKPYLKYFGVGTQQVEEQLLEQFPGVRALRMDRDSTTGKDAHETMLAAFAREEYQVLIGTQMVAKGLDFPNVTLVGVVAADATLHLPDYRSAERTFQLLTQVAGRAGRDEAAGKVIIQTYSPGHPSIRFAKTHDYKGFFMHELAKRHAALFPPFSLFVRALFQGPEEAQLQQAGIAYAKGLEAAIVEALGAHEGELLYLCASPAPIKRRQGMYRFQVLIKLQRTAHTAAALEAVYAFVNAHRAAHFATLEINPGDLL